MAKIKVGVLRGGPSSEHEISLKTGENVLQYLPKKKYEGLDIVLKKDGQLSANNFPIKIQEIDQVADVVFNALHGQFGEDGGIQQILDKIKIPYTGSGCMASALGMNKVLSREFFSEAGLKVPQAIVVKSKENPEEAAMKIFQTIHPFWVVKPASSGSSIGVSIVKNFHDLAPAIRRAFDFSDEAIVEEYIKGREATCGILEGFRGEEHYALPVIEIVPPSQRSFFDYECKYDGSTKEICPSHFDIPVKREIENVAKMAHRALGCGDYSRADMIVSNNPAKGGASGIYLLEVNTLPGLTSESLVPKSAEVVGLEFPNLLDHLVKLALNKAR
jgi:D-alanine-D-alanine ligase